MPKNNKKKLQIRNLGVGGRTCLDSPAGKRNLKKPVGLYPCHRQGGNQVCTEVLSTKHTATTTIVASNKKILHVSAAIRQKKYATATSSVPQTKNNSKNSINNMLKYFTLFIFNVFRVINLYFKPPQLPLSVNPYSIVYFLC